MTHFGCLLPRLQLQSGDRHAQRPPLPDPASRRTEATHKHSTISATTSSGASAFASCPAEPNGISSTASIEGQRVWQIVGDADSLNVDEARSRARAMLAALRRGAGDSFILTTTPSSRLSPRTAFKCVTSASGRRERSTSTHRISTTRFCHASQAAPSPRSTTRRSGAGSPRFARRPRPLTVPCRFSPSSRPGEPQPPLRAVFLRSHTTSPWTRRPRCPSLRHDSWD